MSRNSKLKLKEEIPLLVLATPSPFPPENLPGRTFDTKLSAPYGKREFCGNHILHWIPVDQMEAQQPDAAAHLANAIEHAERYYGHGDKTTVEVRVLNNIPLVLDCVQDAVKHLKSYGVKIVVSLPNGQCSLDVPAPVSAELLQAIRDAGPQGPFVHPMTKNPVYMK